MSKEKPIKRIKKVLSITVSPATAEKVKLLAEAENRNVSNYIETLILKQEISKK